MGLLTLVLAVVVQMSGKGEKVATRGPVCSVHDVSLGIPCKVVNLIRITAILGYEYRLITLRHRRIINENE